MEHVLEPLHTLDWNDVDAVEHATRKALVQLADDRDLVRDAVRALPDRPDLLALCEHYDILDKLALYQDETGIRVRLHVFLPGHFDRPHNHRWSYSSLILRGSYRHYLFGVINVDTEPDPGQLTALVVRQEAVGDIYALHHTMVHAVVAEPFTVSLVIRGPAVKDRFLVMDRNTGARWWQYGAQTESTAEAARKRMSHDRLAKLTRKLQEWELI